MIPQAVVFDLGKVLVDFDYSIATQRIAAHGTLPAAQVYRWFCTSPLLLQYESGSLSKEQFFKEICAATGFRGGLAEFGQFFADIFSPIDPMIDLHAQLRVQKVPTYIFSNTNDLAIDHIRANFPFFKHFDDFIFSYEHGVMKPEAGLYEVVERMSGRKGPEILYLDDRLENVEAGARRGWQIIHHTAPETTRALVQKLGLLGNAAHDASSVPVLPKV